MDSAIDQEFYRYFTQLDDEQKTSMLQLLKTFLKGGSQNTERISIEEYNREIDEALAQAAAGNYISQDEMEKRAVKW